MELLARHYQVVIFIVSVSGISPSFCILYPEEVAPRRKSERNIPVVTRKTYVYFILHITDHFEVFDPYFNIYVG
jgi:hypothetical protein